MSGVSLVIQTSYLGDMVLTTPLIAELATRGPVDVVATPASAGLLANNPFVRKLFVYDKRGSNAGFRGLLRMARSVSDFYRSPESRAVPRERTAYMAQGSVRSAALARLAGVRTLVGFDSSAAHHLYTVRVPHDGSAHHTVRLWSLAGAGSAMPAGEVPPPRLYPGDAERAAVDQLLGHHADPRPLVVLAPGSAWATKRWPYYPRLAARIADGNRLAVVGSAADSDLARLIIDAVGAQGVVDATGKLSLLASAELIGRADVVVSNDSLPQHLASAMSTPTVTIFGPTAPEFGFGPLAPRSVTVRHPSLPCQPCHHHGLHKCPLGHLKCMLELDVEVVERAVGSILEGTSKGKL
ncbi:MAG TPA: glycosyltransferase family 9 protein [Gemmatimonadaceae bacterium]|nr:glycosyltransferase family 9 protein [Gemmatimonadaceae bacterium]